MYLSVKAHCQNLQADNRVDKAYTKLFIQQFLFQRDPRSCKCHRVNQIYNNTFEFRRSGLSTFRFHRWLTSRVAVISAKNHKRQRRKRQSVTAKREKSHTPKVLTAILTLPNLT